MVNITQAYNLTELKAADSLIDIATYANKYSDGMLFGVLPFGIFFIILMIPGIPITDKFLGGSVAGLVLSVSLAAAGLINPFFILVFIIMSAFSGFASYLLSKSAY